MTKQIITKAEAAHILLIKDRAKLFSVTFTKKDGTERNMVARLDCHNRKKTNQPSTVAHIPKYVTVFDMQKDSFRNVNLNTITRLKSRGIEYEVE